MGRSPRRGVLIWGCGSGCLSGVGVKIGRIKKVAGPGLTQVRMSQAVEVVLIQAGLFVLWAWALLEWAGCSGQGSHHVRLTLTVFFSPFKAVFVLGFLTLDPTYKAMAPPQPAVWLQPLRPRLMQSGCFPEPSPVNTSRGRGIELVL